MNRNILKIALQSIIIAVTVFNFIFGQEYHIALQKKDRGYATEIELLFNSNGIPKKIKARNCFIGRGERGRPDEAILWKPEKSLFNISEEIKGNNEEAEDEANDALVDILLENNELYEKFIYSNNEFM